jgi:hypothetical protein
MRTRVESRFDLEKINRLIYLSFVVIYLSPQREKKEDERKLSVFRAIQKIKSIYSPEERNEN